MLAHSFNDSPNAKIAATMESVAPTDQPGWDQLAGYCKYVSADPVVLDGIFSKHKIRFTQVWDLNDPLELNPILDGMGDAQHQMYVVDGVLMPSTEMWYRTQLIESQINEFGVLSLTKNPTSYDMWSKYASGHRGFVIELRKDFNEHPAFRSSDGEMYPVKPVNYVDEFRINLSDLARDSGEFTTSEFNERFFYSKTRRWQSELEFRLVRHLADLGKPRKKKVVGVYREPGNVYTGDLPLEVVESVVFGTHMSREDKASILQSCRGHQVQFLQAFLFRGEKDQQGYVGDIKLLPLENKALLDQVLRFAPQTFVVDSLESRAGKRSVPRVEDLPYYPINSDLVREMFQARSQSVGADGVVGDKAPISE